MANAQSRGIEVTDPQEYRRKLKEFIGDRKPLAIMAETADTLSAMVSKHTTKQFRTRPFEGKWTPLEVIGHLLDCEYVYGFRMRLILSEDMPTILGMDQDKWVAAQRYNDREPAELVDMFRSLRKCNLAIWKQMAPADFERAGQHNERGRESLAQMLPMLAGHDLWHIDQITRYLKAVEAVRS